MSSTKSERIKHLEQAKAAHRAARKASLKVGTEDLRGAQRRKARQAASKELNEARTQKLIVGIVEQKCSANLPPKVVVRLWKKSEAAYDDYIAPSRPAHVKRISENARNCLNQHLCDTMHTLLATVGDYMVLFKHAHLESSYLEAAARSAGLLPRVTPEDRFDEAELRHEVLAKRNAGGEADAATADA